MARIAVTQKQRPNNKTAFDVVEEKEKTQVHLRNLGTRHNVLFTWDINEDTVRDGVFSIKIDDKEALISAEEMRRFLRWV